MNVQAATSETSVESHTVTGIPVARSFYWLVRREVLENRFIYLAHLAAVPFIVLSYAIGFRFSGPGGPGRVEEPFTSASLLLMFISILVALFYSIDALYGERRDRSILFWKSLPVSDWETVLAKASIPIVIIPLITFVVTFGTHVLMLLVAGARTAGTGISVWSQLSFGHMTWVLFCHLLVGHGFWFAPFWGWFLLASAWARRAPFLWATLPPLVIGLLERIAFHTTYFGHALAYRFTGGPATGIVHDHGPMTIASVTPESWGNVFTSPGFWFGLALTAAFLAAAVRLRRDRGPI
jgi:ABC-2 type transport system permease protein